LQQTGGEIVEQCIGEKLSRQFYQTNATLLHCQREGCKKKKEINDTSNG
jgi:hypothetical protein